MKIKFLAGAGPLSYDIQDQVINGIDFSPFVKGAQFVGNEETLEAGIFGAEWLDGVLHVTLGQKHGSLQLPVVSENRWTESDWIDPESYSPTKCYIHCVSAGVPGMLDAAQAEYWRDPDSGAWTVRMIDTPEQEPTQ